jgi:hypothetical protein
MNFTASSSSPVVFKLTELVWRWVSASTTRSTPPLAVTIRRPSVLTRSGSSTPASWVLVVE